MKRGLYLLTGVLIYSIVFGFVCSKCIVLASDLQDQVEDIENEIEDGYLSLEQEIEENDDYVLQDTIDYIQKDYPIDEDIENSINVLEDQKSEKSISGTKSPAYNITPSNGVYYEFSDLSEYPVTHVHYDVSYQSVLSGGTYYQATITLKLYKWDGTIETTTKTSGAKNTNTYYLSDTSGGQNNIDLDVYKGIMISKGSSGSYSPKLYYQIDDTPSPTPDPDITPTPTPDPEQPMYSEDPNYKIMIIFSLGVIAGVLTGTVLLGFIK